MRTSRGHLDISFDGARTRRPVRRASLANQTEQILSDRIVQGDLEPGDQLPAEHELASDLAVSRATVRAAITALVRRGLVVQRHGIGNFVAVGSLLTNDLAEAVDLNELIGRSGAATKVVFDRVAVEAAATGLAVSLGLNPGDMVLQSEKHFVADGHDMIYVSNSIPVAVIGTELANRALLDPSTTEPMFDFLEGSAGAATASQLAEIRPQLTSQIDHAAVDTATVALDPVLRIDETGYTATSRPIWHSTSWYPPSEMRFQLIRHRTAARS